MDERADSLLKVNYRPRPYRNVILPRPLPQCYINK